MVCQPRLGLFNDSCLKYEISVLFDALFNLFPKQYLEGMSIKSVTQCLINQKNNIK